MRPPLPLALLLAAAAPLSLLAAQSSHAAAAAIPPAARQVAAAVTPLPAALRPGAAVLGYDAAGKLVTLRRGSNGMICLASDPKRERFHVACYHESLEPFMARGRALRASGVAEGQVDTMRFAEVKAGTLKMPAAPAALYSLTGGSFDEATGEVSGARPLHVIYIPYATEASTGISAQPAEGTPWLMFPGTPKAHIMFVPRM